MSDPNTHAPEPSGEAPHPSFSPAGAAQQAAAQHQPTVPLPPAAQQPPAAPQQGRPPKPPKASKQPKASKPQGDGPKLSTFLKVSIILLAALTVASISLLFIGDFQGKFERVFSTFALFAIFVTFTALDTRREQKSEWYAPVALIANAYILGLLLLVIWMTPYDSISLIFEIFWKSVFVIVVTRAVILCCQLLIGMSEKHSESVARFAFITSMLAVLSGILFTAPVGIAAFDLQIPDLYWKIATAILILTALGLSITLLLRWALGADAREAARQARIAQAQAAQAAQVQAQAAQPQQGAQLAQPQLAQPAPGAPGLLPWPTFADGRPIPAGPDGQPDFSVPGAPLPPQR